MSDECKEHRKSVCARKHYGGPQGVGRPAIDRRTRNHASAIFRTSLPKFFAAEKPEKCFWKCFQALHNILTGFELASGDPSGNLANGMGISGGVVEHDHAFHARPVDQERKI